MKRPIINRNIKNESDPLASTIYVILLKLMIESKLTSFFTILAWECLSTNTFSIEADSAVLAVWLTFLGLHNAFESLNNNVCALYDSAILGVDLELYDCSFLGDQALGKSELNLFVAWLTSAREFEIFVAQRCDWNEVIPISTNSYSAVGDFGWSLSSDNEDVLGPLRSKEMGLIGSVVCGTVDSTRLIKRLRDVVEAPCTWVKKFHDLKWKIQTINLWLKYLQCPISEPSQIQHRFTPGPCRRSHCVLKDNILGGPIVGEDQNCSRCQGYRY